jgi:leucyl aminopeptidase
VEYNPGGDITKQVFLIGKGITYDTGGADVKTGGHMVGMSRDKCGAAATAGVVAAIATLKQPGVRIVAYLGFVRNSIGSDSYVADEIIKSHAGARVLVVNTDAEGRMVLSDMLSHAREEIAAQDKASRPTTSVFTLATLTGHAVLTVGCVAKREYVFAVWKCVIHVL